MTVKNILRCLIPPGLLIVVAICVTAAQKDGVTKMKRMWSPPISFTIEVPVNLREIKGEYNDESKERFRSIKLFGTSEAEASFGVFEVVILDLSKRNSLM